MGLLRADRRKGAHRRAIGRARHAQRCRPDTRSARHPAVRRAIGGYAEDTIEHDFKATPTAYFLLTPSSIAWSLPLDAKRARLSRSHEEAAREPAMEYDPPRQVARPRRPASRRLPLPPGCFGQRVSATDPPVGAAPRCGARSDRQRGTGRRRSRLASGDVSASVAAATAAWVEAFNSRDPARVAALYDAEAVLTDAAEPKPRDGAAAIADYYKSAAQRPTQRVALGERTHPHLRRYRDRQRHLTYSKCATARPPSRRRAIASRTASAAGSG